MVVDWKRTSKEILGLKLVKELAKRVWLRVFAFV